MSKAKIKKKRCKSCPKWFVPWNSLQVACSPTCALKYAKKQQEEKAKDERRRNKQKKEQLKSRRDLEKEAQVDFNKFIRLRDYYEPCISCLRPIEEVEQGYRFGGHWDAGHYLSRGARPEHRFNEDNCHKQCKQCNSGAGNHVKKNHTVQQSYRVNLIAKIGIARVEALETDHEAKHYTADELREIKRVYRAKWRELEKKLQKT